MHTQISKITAIEIFLLWSQGGPVEGKDLKISLYMEKPS